MVHEPLLERDAEQAELRALIARAHNGHGGMVVLLGAAGLGKTALLERAGELGRGAGALVLNARGQELEREFGWGVVRSLFDAPLRAGTTAQRAELLGGPAAAAGPLFGG